MPPPPRVLVTRSPHQSSELADHLRALGVEPVLIPTIETVDPASFAPLDAALADLDAFHWLLFTSANAVEAFDRRRKLLGPQPITSSIAAIGAATARALTGLGCRVQLVPPLAVAEALSAALLPYALQPDGSPTRFLLIRAEEAREHLPETLRSAGAEVTVVSAYRTIIPATSVQAIRELFASPAEYPDAVTFTSSSAARNFFALLKAARLALPSPILASIGPVTSATLRELGHPPHVEASEASVSSLAAGLVKYLNSWHRGQNS